METTITKRAGFGGVLTDHKRIPDDAPDSAAQKWQRAHDKRELKGYLRGNPLFTHGREPAMPIGFQPKQYRVREVRRPIEKKP